MSLEGQQLGEFEILERLGQGGMGAVYKASQKSLKRMVALKTLQAGLADDAEYIARFEQEAVAAAGLMHPNLVQVFSAGENDGLHWFAMEYVEGESARARLKRKGNLDPLEAIAIAIHVATALEYGWRKAHLIHRDIKPDNIFLSEDGEVKLGDLGLAKSAGQTTDLTITGHSMGTPHYISPEQVESTKSVDLRADIYSLGCTLFHMLSGQPPFDGNSAVSIMMKHITEPVPILKQVWPECSQTLSDVVEKMMQKQPGERQQDYATVINDLRQAYDVVSGEKVAEAVTDQKPATSKASGSIPPQKPTPGRSKVPIYAGIGVAVLVIAAFLLFKPKSQNQAREATTFSSIATVTTAAPFVNSLGMKFVPVPGTQVVFSIWDTRVQDYKAYATANPTVDGSWKTQNKDAVPVSRDPDYPVVGVSWDDAQAFNQWLTNKEIAEGKLPKAAKYRLPSDEEWSVAVGLPNELGATPVEKSGKNSVDFPWGKDYPPRQKLGNYADESFHQKFPQSDPKDPKVTNQWIAGYDDGYATTSPVGSFPANAYGLYDMGGNVWQWCEDWYDASHQDRVLRGAAWDHSARNARLSSFRNHYAPDRRIYSFGFRCVLELPKK